MYAIIKSVKEDAQSVTQVLVRGSESSQGESFWSVHFKDVWTFLERDVADRVCRKFGSEGRVVPFHAANDTSS